MSRVISRYRREYSFTFYSIFKLYFSFGSRSYYLPMWRDLKNTSFMAIIFSLGKMHPAILCRTQNGGGLENPCKYEWDIRENRLHISGTDAQCQGARKCSHSLLLQLGCLHLNHEEGFKSLVKLELNWTGEIQSAFFWRMPVCNHITSMQN